MTRELDKINEISIRWELMAEVIARHADMPSKQAADSDAVISLISEYLSKRGLRSPDLTNAIFLRITALARLLEGNQFDEWRTTTDLGDSAINTGLVRVAASEPIMGTLDRPAFDTPRFRARLLL